MYVMLYHLKERKCWNQSWKVLFWESDILIPLSFYLFTNVNYYMYHCIVETEVSLGSQDVSSFLEHEENKIIVTGVHCTVL